MKTNNNEINKICMLGTAFSTGNLGVSALGESSIKVLLHRWPNAEITILGDSRNETEHELRLFDRDITVKCLPIRFSKNIFLPSHFFIIVFYGLLLKVFRSKKIQQKIVSGNKCVRAFHEADFAVDITGGDSFSDIYGFKRLFIGILKKWLLVLFGKKMVMMPQTYGPFKKKISRKMAGNILDHASIIFSRDPDAIDYINGMCSKDNKNEIIKFVPDVAFVLDPKRPQNEEMVLLEEAKNKSEILIGLNVSGMLLLDHRSGCEMFSSQINYPDLISEIIKLLMGYKGVELVLIPHVLGSKQMQTSTGKSSGQKGYELDDFTACKEIYEQAAEEYKSRIFLVQERYDHNEMKGIIGMCDFFLGSRMHSCIAALSQEVPTVGLAYSKKFDGIFESVGTKDTVLDLRLLTEEVILKAIKDAFENREQIMEKLNVTVPEVKSKVLNMFSDLKDYLEVS
ncbi:MAG: hypothetical protein FVQ82_07740 [Planctomycetes bacterium]|nr:hypothetical protein [Planctomycetota bacterium]